MTTTLAPTYAVAFAVVFTPLAWVLLSDLDGRRRWHRAAALGALWATAVTIGQWIGQHR